MGIRDRVGRCGGLGALEVEGVGVRGGLEVVGVRLGPGRRPKGAGVGRRGSAAGDTSGHGREMGSGVCHGGLLLGGRGPEQLNVLAVCPWLLRCGRGRGGGGGGGGWSVLGVLLVRHLAGGSLLDKPPAVGDGGGVEGLGAAQWEGVARGGGGPGLGGGVPGGGGRVGVGFVVNLEVTCGWEE